MYSRRDWLLQKMGITQYTLRRTHFLKGQIRLTLPTDTKLLIIGEILPSPQDPLVSDVLRALDLKSAQVQFFTPDQLAILPDDTHCHSWCLGLNAPVNLLGTQIISPILEEIYHNANAKRALWQQICQYESNFFTHDARP